MPNPCPDGDWTHCHGPFRVALQLAPPDGYTEQWTITTVGVPRRVSEIATALWDAYSELPGDAVAELTETEESGRIRGPKRTPIRLGAELVRRGAPDVHDTTPGLWTVHVRLWAPFGGCPEVLDWAYLAAQWAGRVREINLPSAGPAGLRTGQVAAEIGSSLLPLPEGYPLPRVDEHAIGLTRELRLGEPEPDDVLPDALGRVPGQG